MSKVLVVLETRDGAVTRASWEALTAARAVGESIAAVVPDADAQAPAAEAALRGVERVIRLEHPLLASYSADGYTSALAQLVRAEEPAFIVFPHSYQTRDFAPAVAARFGQMLINDVVAVDEGKVFTRPIFDGRMMAACRIAGAGPVFVSVQSGAFPAAEATSSSAPIEIFTPEIAAEDIRIKMGEPFRAEAAQAALGSAARIVSVGRGIGGEEHLPLARALAEALGAELAASRPVCDAGWLSADRQVGSSGQTVAPKLYVALGISGATQHLQGMRGSECIVAINKDPDAPIFEVSHYGIVGDLFEVVPALTELLRKPN